MSFHRLFQVKAVTPFLTHLPRLQKKHLVWTSSPLPKKHLSRRSKKVGILDFPTRFRCHRSAGCQSPTAATANLILPSFDTDIPATTRIANSGQLEKSGTVPIPSSSVNSSSKSDVPLPLLGNLGGNPHEISRGKLSFLAISLHS